MSFSSLVSGLVSQVRAVVQADNSVAVPPKATITRTPHPDASTLKPSKEGHCHPTSQSLYDGASVNLQQLSEQYLDSNFDLDQTDNWDDMVNASLNDKLQSWLSPVRAKLTSVLHGEVKNTHLLGPQKLKHAGKLTVALDLDETLIHSEFVSTDGSIFDPRQPENRRHANAGRKPDFVYELPTEAGMQTVYVYKRPGLDAFLRELSQVAEIVIFTASVAPYADPIIDFIDPTGYISARLYRESTTKFRNRSYVKNMSHLGRDLKRTVLIDNSAIACLASPANSIVVPDYIDSPHDSELPRLTSLLKRLHVTDDVRKVISESATLRVATEGRQPQLKPRKLDSAEA